MQIALAGLGCLLSIGGFIAYFASVTYWMEIGIAGVVCIGIVLLLPDRNKMTPRSEQSELSEEVPVEHR